MVEYLLFSTRCLKEGCSLLRTRFFNRVLSKLAGHFVWLLRGVLGSSVRLLGAGISTEQLVAAQEHCGGA